MSLATESYHKLKQHLFSSEVRPDTRFSINELSRRLGIGRSPVRDAVKRLAAEGLLQSVARSGVMLKQLSGQDLQEIVELREALEPYAVRNACLKIDYEQKRHLRLMIGRMRKNARKIADSRFEDAEACKHMAAADRNFHETILDAADNTRLKQIVENYQLLTSKIRYPSTHTLRHLALTVLEHWRIYQAVVKGSPDDAEFWMMRHSRRGGREMIKSLDDVYGEE